VTPGVIPDGECFGLVHGLLAVPAADSDELTREGDLDKRVVGAAGVHLALFDEGVAPFVKFKELLALFSTADIDLTVERALEDGAEVAEGVLHILHVDHSGGEIFEVVHDQLLFVRHEDSYAVLL